MILLGAGVDGGSARIFRMMVSMVFLSTWILVAAMVSQLFVTSVPIATATGNWSRKCLRRLLVATLC